MANANIRTHVRTKDRVGIIDIVGEVNGAAEEEMMKAFNAVSEKGAKSILLNFTKLEFMNSSGIGLLVTLLIRANRNRQKLLACGLNRHYQEIFSLTRLNEVISIFDTETQALAAT
jgi:anti-sigma B factor antagonist